MGLPRFVGAGPGTARMCGPGAKRGERVRRIDRQGRFRQTALALRLASLAGASLALANCAGPTARTGIDSETKYGVKASPRVVAEGDPVPKGGGRDMVGKPYVVAGRTYVPSATAYKKEGWASWYGTAFHGRLTANGEVFDRASVAAAHPTMPLPSYVRVTNTVNKRSMIVRVNDRGPYEGDRVLDVSERVAEALDFRRRGTARVRIEYVGRASLRGSDDEKLLATLTTNGSPAPFGGRRTMLADLREEPAPRPAVPVAVDPDAAPRPRTIVVAATPLARPEPTADDEPREAATESLEEGGDALHPLPPRRPSAFASIRVASAEPDRAAVEAFKLAPPAAAADPLPPQRPRFGGIY